MIRPNIRLENTDVVHAHARSEREILRCGVRFVRHEQERGPSDTLCRGFDTEDPVDCMTCLVRHELSCANLIEIIALELEMEMEEKAAWLETLNEAVTL